MKKNRRYLEVAVFMLHVLLSALVMSGCGDTEFSSKRENLKDEVTENSPVNPPATVETIDFVVEYYPASTDPSPELVGEIGDPNAQVIVKVQDYTYPAINNGDGTWILPDDTIIPDLELGTHTLEVVAILSPDLKGTILIDITVLQASHRRESSDYKKYSTKSKSSKSLKIFRPITKGKDR